MAEQSGIFPSVNGDRRYFTSFFAEYFADFISNGIYPNPSTMCQGVANNDMTVILKPGNGYINGFKYTNDSDKIFNIDTADGVLKRIDRIVLRHTILNREIKAYVKKGTFASSPVAPSLQRDADMWELGVFDVFVNNGAISITQSNITDLRLNNTYCGIVHGVISQVDTTTIFNQFQAWYLETVDGATTDIATMLSAFQSSFNAWFANLQDILDENTAGNLLSMINNNTSDIVTLDTRVSKAETKLFTDTIGVTWENTVVPYKQRHALSAVTSSNTVVEVSCAASATVKQMEAFDALRLKDGGQGVGYFDIAAIGEKNTEAIPINITVRGD